MKEINTFFKNNPNGRNIIIPKKTENLNVNNLYEAFQKMKTVGERSIFVFLYTYPETNVKIGFSKEISQKMNIGESSRHEGFKNLVTKGYLKQLNDFDYIFIENPAFKETIAFPIIDNSNNKSTGIQCIEKLLELNNIKFESENIFSDCRFLDTGYVAYFDIMVQNKYIIEYDGEQHFKSIDFFGGEKIFNKTREHDLHKNKYCFDNNIPIIRIPYTKKATTITIDDLKLETTKFLLTPENEQEYYNSRA